MPVDQIHKQKMTSKSTKGWVQSLDPAKKCSTLYATLPMLLKHIIVALLYDA